LDDLTKQISFIETNQYIFAKIKSGEVEL
jgi:hypothetical protein